MNRTKEPFEIRVQLSKPETACILIKHESETFDFEFEGKNISLINNGDNSWSSVENNLSQEDVNLIGTEIEKHYQQLAV